LDPRIRIWIHTKISWIYNIDFQDLIGRVEAGVETAATAAALSLPDLEAVALGLDTLRHNLPVSGQLKEL
jgi:hypothetical protein